MFVAVSVKMETASALPNRAHCDDGDGNDDDGSRGGCEDDDNGNEDDKGSGGAVAAHANENDSDDSDGNSEPDALHSGLMSVSRTHIALTSSKE